MFIQSELASACPLWIIYSNPTFLEVRCINEWWTLVQHTFHSLTCDLPILNVWVIPRCNLWLIIWVGNVHWLAYKCLHDTWNGITSFSWLREWLSVFWLRFLASFWISLVVRYLVFFSDTVFMVDGRTSLTISSHILFMLRRRRSKRPDILQSEYLKLERPS